MNGILGSLGIDPFYLFIIVFILQYHHHVHQSLQAKHQVEVALEAVPLVEEDPLVVEAVEVASNPQENII